MSIVHAGAYGGGGTPALGSAVVLGTAKVWGNFNTTGTIATRDSENVASITDSGVGLYTVAITSALTDIYFACNLTRESVSVNANCCVYDVLSSRTSSQVYVGNFENNVLADTHNLNLFVEGDLA